MTHEQLFATDRMQLAAVRTVADVLERSLLQSVAAAPSSLREQLAQELEALARLLRRR
jgi:hypothetical protein